MATLRFSPPHRTTKDAAILVPLVEHHGLSVLFEVRSATVRQPGEVCFPGGGMEGQESPVVCALRETEEELGVPAASVELLGSLDPVLHMTGRTVWPFVGVIQGSLDALRLSTQEVAESFLVPLTWLRKHPPQHCSYDMVPDLESVPAVLSPYVSRYRNRRNTPVWVYEGHVIWGLTARILLEVLDHLEEG